MSTTAQAFRDLAASIDKITAATRALQETARASHDRAPDPRTSGR